MGKIFSKIKKMIPKNLWQAIQPAYHYSLALLGALIYRFPSEEIKVIGVTGTKGKTSTVEFVNAILEEAGKKTALAGTLRFKIGNESKPNLYKMTMPGRMFIQKFLRKAVDAGCEYAVIEISSEAAKQYRNKFIDLDTLIFTNLAPEHIESHGSYGKYLEAKLSIAKSLEKSCKENRTVISNVDDAEGRKFLEINVQNNISYSLSEVKDIKLDEDLTKFVYKGIEFESRLPGRFNVYNMLAAIKNAEIEGIDLMTIRNALLKMKEIKGRAERIDEGQDFKVVVDYAHTSDSMKAIYEAFKGSRKIAVFGSCGGGRDKWKRKEMAEVAEKYCENIILTDEDPYDDDPREIVEDLAKYIKNNKAEIVMNRREAIAKAFKMAKKNDAVIITGKGTDPYIMRKNGEKEKWSDAEVAREELRKILEK